jgi:regulator of protease activity HflC (stomatin/prohibitin superfamily)
MVWIILGIALLLLLFARFTVVDEATAKAVMFLGQFQRIIFRWKGHWIDKEGTIWKDGEMPENLENITLEQFRKENEEGWQNWPLRILGGLYLYGILFIHSIHKYKHRWTDIIIRPDGKIETKGQEEEFKYVMLKPAVYAIRLFDVKTMPPERIPVTVLVLVTMRIVNPYKFLFIAPPTPIEDTLARIGAEARAIVTGCSLDELLKLRGESLWSKGAETSLLKGAKIIEETLEKWGIRLADKAVEIRDIDLPPDYQEAAAAKRKQEFEAAARAEMIIGTVISAVVRASGQSESQVQAEFQKNPEDFYKKHQCTIDNTMTKLSMEEGAYVRIETPGATGFGGDLLRFIAAWKKIPTGSLEERPTENKKGEEKGKKTEESVPTDGPLKFLGEKRPMERHHQRKWKKRKGRR